MAKRKSKKVASSGPEPRRRMVPPVSAAELDAVAHTPLSAAGALTSMPDPPKPARLTSKVPVQWPKSAKCGKAAKGTAARGRAAGQDPNQLTSVQIYETLAALLVPYARRMESEMHPKIGFC